MEHNLNGAIERCRAELERVHLRLDLLLMAELQAAGEQLDGARRTGSERRAAEMLRDADRTFQKHRNYYHALIVTVRPATNPKIPVPEVTELYSRFLACGLAELEANLLAGDLELWTFRHAVLCQQVDETLRVEAREIFHARADAAGLLSSNELRELQRQARAVQDYCRESRDRLISSAEEVHWLERSGLSPREYLSELSAMTEPDVVLVRHE